MNQERKIQRPLIFKGVVKQEEGNAIHILHDTDDERLIGHTIPNGVKDPAEYMKQYSHFLDAQMGLIETPVVQPNTIVRGTTDIIKAKNMNFEDDTTNFKVIPLKKYIFKDRLGKEEYDKEYFDCHVVFEDGMIYDLMLRTVEISKVIRIVTQRFSKAIVYGQVPIAQKNIENLFRERSGNIPVITIFTQAGWQRIDGKIIYLHDGCRLPSNYRVDTGLELPYMDIYKNRYAEVYWNSLNIFLNSNVMHTISLYSFMGILYRCFEEAGYPPRFLLFLNGKTGSFKTTISKILFNQLCDNRFRESPRRVEMDTETSIELGITLWGWDTIIFYDDYCPAKTRKKKEQMADKLELLIRMAGDGSTKSRSNSNLQDVRGSGVHGMIVVTGELQGKGFSSNLRCLYVKLTGEDANINCITWFQENAYAYTSLMNHFAEYVGANWNSIVELIKQRFPVFRKELAVHLPEKRLADSASVLSVCAEILYGFLTQYCRQDCTLIQNHVEAMKKSVLITTATSMSETQDTSYSLIFLKAVHELMQLRRICLYEKKPESVDQFDAFAGYYDDDSYYFYLPAMYPIVKNYLISMGQGFMLDADEIANELFQDGISVPGSNGKNADGSPRRYKYQRIQIKGKSSKISIIKIKMAVFESVVNCENAEQFREKFHE